MSETRELERDLRKGLKVSKKGKKRSRLGTVLKGGDMVQNFEGNDSVYFRKGIPKYKLENGEERSE